MNKKPKRTTRVQNATFYLGRDERQARLQNLDAIAAELGYENRSELIRMIADRKLELRKQQSA